MNVVTRAISLALSASCAAGFANAQQISISTQSSTPLGVLCSSGGQQDFEVVAAGTPISSSPSNVFVSAGLSQNVYLSATTIAYPTQPYQEGIGLNYFQRAYARGAATDVAGTSGSAQANGAVHGPQTLRITFTGTPARAGRIVFNFRASAGATGSVSASLDIDADGTVELQTTTARSQEFAYTLPASGAVTLLASSACLATGTGNTQDLASTWSELWVGFRPDITAQCTITSYGAGCGGASAAGAENVIGTQRVVTFLVTGAYANSPVLSVVGTGSMNLPLPAGCVLLSTIESALVLQADGAGIATQSWAFPATMVGTSYHQFLPVRLSTAGTLELSATQGLRVDCRR